MSMDWCVSRAWLRVVAAIGFVAAAAVGAEAQRVTAVWDANTDPYTVGYRLYVGTTPGAVDTEFDVGNTTRHAVDLPGAGTYYFAVRAYNQAGDLGPASNIAAYTAGGSQLVPPGVPSGISASVSGSLATLRWNAPTSGGPASGYALFVGSAPGASNLINGQALGPGLSVSDHVPPGTYFARLAAYNAAGASAQSQEISFRVGTAQAPGTPVGVTVSLQGTLATLSWVPPAPDSGPTAATSYVIEVGTAPGARNVGSFNIGNATRFSSQVAPGVYYVRVRAVNAAGVSAPSAEVVLRYGTPGAPRSLVASVSRRSSRVTLSWMPPSDRSATGYVIEVGTARGLSNVVVAPVGNVTTLTTSAPPGVYYVRVRAINGAGAGAASNEIVVRR